MPTIAEFNKHPALVRLSAYGDLSAGDLRALFALINGSRRLAKGTYLYRETDEAPGIYLLLEGWAASSIATANAKRQLLRIHLPGDVVGLPGLPYDTAPDTVVALTDIVVGRVDLKALGAIFDYHPHLSAKLFMVSQEERLALMERLFLIGSQDAIAQVSGVIVQLLSQVSRQSPDLDDWLEMPLTQADFADLLGITPIHLNRTLKEMKQRGLLTWSRKGVALHDKAVLQRLAGLPKREIRQIHSWFPNMETDHHRSAKSKALNDTEGSIVLARDCSTI